MNVRVFVLLLLLMVVMVEMVVMVRLTTGEEAADVVQWTELRPDMEEVNSGGTHGEEGNVHPGSDLQTELLRL